MKTNETSKLILIDPPSGWRYGFPKAVTQKQYTNIFNLTQWCVDNGYPQEEVDSYGDTFHIQISGELPKKSQYAPVALERVKDFKHVVRPNQKQYKEFSPSLFKAYINKFSRKDLLLAYFILTESINNCDE